MRFWLVAVVLPLDDPRTGFSWTVIPADIAGEFQHDPILYRLMQVEGSSVEEARSKAEEALRALGRILVDHLVDLVEERAKSN